MPHTAVCDRRAALEWGAYALAGSMLSTTGHAQTIPAPHTLNNPGTVMQASDRLPLGSSDITVSPLGVGCMGMSEFYGPTDAAEVQRTLDAALERGVNFFDTADMYGRGANEELLAPLLTGRRDRIVLASKFGIVRDANGVHFDNRPDYVKRACEASLRRLKTDYIDVFYAHRIDRKHPVEDMVGAMADLVREGKVRAIGLSEAAPATIRQAHRIHPLAAVQTEYSLFSRGPESEILPTCRALGIAFVPYAPLCRGLLSGQARDATHLGPGDFRQALPRFQPANFVHNQALVERLAEYGQRQGRSSAQIALAWLRAKGNDIVPIPGMRSVRHLDENLGALTMALSGDDVAAIEALLPIQAVAGERYSDAELMTVGL
jgi:aryl-alcohol dehydrogenase-like predicted oxidoreductase